MTTHRVALGGPRVLVLGRPGSGKGTQCGRLAARLGVPHISTGELFRAIVATDTPLGQMVRGYVEAGELVPDDLVIEVVDDRLRPDGAAIGFVLDGFPRTVTQAEQLVEMLVPHALDVAIDLVVPAEVARARLALRGRPDDGGATVDRRLALYDRVHGPLCDWLTARGLLEAVDGVGRPDEVADRLAAVCAGIGGSAAADLAS